MDNADNIFLSINSWGANQAKTPMSSTEKWHHLVGTYDKSNIKLYLDGVLKDTDAYTDSITYSSNVFQIGGASGWSNLTGAISSVGIYSDAKSASFISTQYSNGIDADLSSDSNLVGYWKLDTASTSSNAITDLSPNSNHGTISGNPPLTAVALDSTDNNNEGTLV
jgi:hypothetical protein